MAPPANGIYYRIHNDDLYMSLIAVAPQRSGPRSAIP